MNDDLRDYFDRQLEFVLTQVPQRVRDLLDEVPMYVEDYPSASVLRRLGMRNRKRLCGLYTGIPLTHRNVQQSGVLSDVIHLYREGILLISRDSTANSTSNCYVTRFVRRCCMNWVIITV